MRLSLWSLALLLVYALDGWGADYGFRVLKAELVPATHDYLLNAEVDYQFSEAVIEALEHGVPLTLVIRFKVHRHRDYWLDETVFSESRRLRIRFHPLAKSFQILPEASGIPQNFASFAAMLDALGSIRGWRVLPRELIEPGQEYWASLAVHLDIEALPLPLRPVAYVSPSWYLSSPWFRWRIAG
ncbi:DUF4390 domain-containing protein [Candidatus Methylocalor cossyra]|uniref:DUF4390 domain-containing protein n=1 Tax=Candidatus Methylocalor cossyra TaxID=3108543 RepID=A0ABM9NED4_9GAMM